MERLQSGGRPENKRMGGIENYNLNRGMDILGSTDTDANIEVDSDMSFTNRSANLSRQPRSSNNGINNFMEREIGAAFKKSGSFNDPEYKVEALNGYFGKMNNAYSNSTRGSVHMSEISDIGGFDTNLSNSSNSFSGIQQKKSKNTLEMLNDRELFNHFSNGNEQIDMTNTKPEDFNMGMPIHNAQILNNKKNLINNPHFSELNNSTQFMPNNSNTKSNINSGPSDMYAELEEDIKGNNSLNPDLDFGVKKNTVEQPDIIERGICVYEYTYSKDREKNFVSDICTPFGLAYLWKSLVMLTKNPSTNKIIEMLGIKNKDQVISDIKIYSELFNDLGVIEYLVPLNNKMINTNFTNKLEEIYKIKVVPIDKNLPNSVINMIFKFELKIPFYYQPTIITDYLLNYSNNKIKFINLVNAPCGLEIDRVNSIVNLEIPMGENMILGFMYNLERNNITNTDLLYDKIIKQREINTLVKTLVIPKISRNKKSNYGKKFDTFLNSIHLGEIIYGNIYNIDIVTEIELNITTDREVGKNKYEIKSNIDEIKINHRCYFYIKNTNVLNKILLSGMINY